MKSNAMMWVCSSGEIYLSTSLDSFRFNAFLDFLKTFQSYGLIFAQMRFGLIISNAMRCAIWYHMYNLNNVKNTHRGVLLLVRLD